MKPKKDRTRQRLRREAKSQQRLVEAIVAARHAERYIDTFIGRDAGLHRVVETMCARGISIDAEAAEAARERFYAKYPELRAWWQQAAARFGGAEETR